MVYLWYELSETFLESTTEMDDTHKDSSRNENYVTIGSYKFQQVKDFVYLRTIINFRRTKCIAICLHLGYTTGVTSQRIEVTSEVLCFRSIPIHGCNAKEE